MFRRQSTLLSFVSLLLLTVASIASAQSLLDLPPCAQPCAEASSTVAGCSPSDRACQCKSSNWQSDTLSCARKGCTNEDFSSTIGELQGYCAGQGNPPPPPPPPSTTPSSSSSAQATTKPGTTSSSQASSSTSSTTSATTNNPGVTTTVTTTPPAAPGSPPPTTPVVGAQPTTTPLGNLPGSPTTRSGTTVVLSTVTAEPTINAAVPAFGGVKGGLGMAVLGMLGLVVL